MVSEANQCLEYQEPNLSLGVTPRYTLQMMLPFSEDELIIQRRPQKPRLSIEKTTSSCWTGDLFGGKYLSIEKQRLASQLLHDAQDMFRSRFCENRPLLNGNSDKIRIILTVLEQSFGADIMSETVHDAIVPRINRSFAKRPLFDFVHKSSLSGRALTQLENACYTLHRLGHTSVAEISELTPRQITDLLAQDGKVKNPWRRTQEISELFAILGLSLGVRALNRQRSEPEFVEPIPPNIKPPKRLHLKLVKGTS